MRRSFISLGSALTSVQYNYTDSARRLLKGALACADGNASLETAGHLAGLSAECVLKSILIGLQIVQADSDGQLPRAKEIKRSSLFART